MVSGPEDGPASASIPKHKDGARLTPDDGAAEPSVDNVPKAGPKAGPKGGSAARRILTVLAVLAAAFAACIAVVYHDAKGAAPFFDVHDWGFHFAGEGPAGFRMSFSGDTSSSVNPSYSTVRLPTRPQIPGACSLLSTSSPSCNPQPFYAHVLVLRSLPCRAPSASASWKYTIPRLETSSCCLLRRLWARPRLARTRCSHLGGSPRKPSRPRTCV